jgi:uncharacterized membrane protein HdeD (DUF308 family)
MDAEYTQPDGGRRSAVMKPLGIALIVAGILALALPYITFTKKEKVIDIGPIEAVAEKQESIPVSPIVGGILLLAGAGITIAAITAKKA